MGTSTADMTPANSVFLIQWTSAGDADIFSDTLKTDHKPISLIDWTFQCRCQIGTEIKSISFGAKIQHTLRKNFLVSASDLWPYQSKSIKRFEKHVPLSKKFREKKYQKRNNFIAARERRINPTKYGTVDVSGLSKKSKRYSILLFD